MLRRVEFNGRKALDDPNAWSVRQTAVYHRFQSSKEIFATEPGKASRVDNRNKSMFIFIAPSKNAEAHIGKCLDPSQMSPWDVQRLLVADSLRGWSDYMACLNAELDKQSQRIVDANITHVDTKAENLPALTDIYITFEDRQELKKLQNAIHDLQLTLPTALQNIECIQKQCKKAYNADNMHNAERVNFDTTMEEFDEYIIEAKLHVDRAKALEDRAKSTTKLVSLTAVRTPESRLTFPLDVGSA